jgi:hypothetical protein
MTAPRWLTTLLRRHGDLLRLLFPLRSHRCHAGLLRSTVGVAASNDPPGVMVPFIRYPVGGCSGLQQPHVRWHTATSPLSFLFPWRSHMCHVTYRYPVGWCSGLQHPHGCPSGFNGPTGVLVTYINPVGVSAVCNGSIGPMVTYNVPVGVRVADNEAASPGC